MKQEYQDIVLRACGASSLRVGAKIQTLWSGYGEIVRLHLDGGERPSVIIKHVRFPAEAEHPGGWNTNRSHLRKVRSYQVETHWYQNYSTSQDCRIPACLAACSHGDEMLMVLEDLDAAGYSQRRFVSKGPSKEQRLLLSFIYLGESMKNMFLITMWTCRPNQPGSFL